MKMLNIPDMMSEVLNDESVTKDQLDLFKKTLCENGEQADAKSMRSLFLFLLVSIIWLLIKWAKIEHLAYGGFKIEDMKILLLTLPVLASFFYYRYQVQSAFFSMIDAALREYYNKKLEPLSTKGLTELLVPPSFFEIENAISNLQESDGWLRDFWIVIMDRLFAILPLLLILYMTYSVIVMPDIQLIWSLPCIILVFIICLRGFWIYRCSLKAIVLQNS